MIKKIKRLGIMFDPKILPKKQRGSICNPCIIRTPAWFKKKLGKYYLYFADHRGTFIKLLFSNDLNKNWKFLNKKILNIKSKSKLDAYNHIASPEVFINNKEKKIYMFTHSHSRSKIGQWTYLSISNDGINFVKKFNNPLAPFYFRLFKHKNNFYGIVKGGDLWRSKQINFKYKKYQNLITQKVSKTNLHNKNKSIRHVGILKKKNYLHCVFSRIGDKPERIFYTKINLHKKFEKWKFQKIKELIRPIFAYEGSNIKLKKSKPGDAPKPENALRDPYLFSDKGKTYLIYCVKGEKNFAICELL